MSTVWILFEKNYKDGEDVVKCFTTEEKAKEYLKNLNGYSEKDKQRYFFIDDFEVQ
jgi:hypothetical protein